MNIKKLLHTNVGTNIISILLGLGLAGLFRKVCDDRNCLRFNGPSLDDIKDKVFKHSGKCYTYEEETETCNQKDKVIIPFA
tara:strand:+ start:215 stop:457 length:243 start_codon:yes stop_codon:yes gene_type:complete